LGMWFRMGQFEVNRICLENKLLWSAAKSGFYIFLWITLSTIVVMSNKWILAYYGFAYPITLTMWHMAFSGVLAFVIIRLEYVAPAEGVDTTIFLQGLLPIAALFSATLWFANAAYMYLSVSFTQMLKVHSEGQTTICEEQPPQMEVSTQIRLHS
jgi:Triose-phosphate Transporter family